MNLIAAPKFLYSVCNGQWFQKKWKRLVSIQKCLGSYFKIHLLSADCLNDHIIISVTKTLERRPGSEGLNTNCVPPAQLLSELWVLRLGKDEAPSACCLIHGVFLLSHPPACPCLPRSVRRLCWSACWKSCGSWLWTPWKRPSSCRHSQIKQWEHSHTRAHTHTFENVQDFNDELLVRSRWRSPLHPLYFPIT